MRLLSTLCLLIASALGVCAQTRPIDAEPPLSTAFPFVKKGDNVSLSYPVLVSSTTIVPANAILRVIYVPPVVGDDRLRAIRSTSNNDASWTRNNNLSPSDKLPPSEVARRKISRETIWPSVTNFQLALASLNTDDIRIVYLVPGSSGDPSDFKFYDEHIALPDGLLLGEINQSVTVIAVEKNSGSSKADIKAGDIIVKAGDTPVNGSLATFLNAYHGVRHAAEVSLKTSFPLTVKSADGKERVAAVNLPPTISGGFLDAPIISTKSNTSSTNTPALTVPEVWENRKPTQTATTSSP
jgi:hypothetical protein